MFPVIQKNSIQCSGETLAKVNMSVKKKGTHSPPRSPLGLRAVWREAWGPAPGPHTVGGGVPRPPRRVLPSEAHMQIKTQDFQLFLKKWFCGHRAGISTEGLLWLFSWNRSPVCLIPLISSCLCEALHPLCPMTHVGRAKRIHPLWSLPPT